MSNFKKTRTTALVLLGHGSHYNAESSVPIYRQAQLIEKRKLFDQVQIGFWKEEPNICRVLDSIWTDDIFIVPFFISRGYFTQQILPQELGLNKKITIRNGQQIFYTEPIGTHPAITNTLYHSAKNAFSFSSASEASKMANTTLIIVGHGTSQNENSRKAIETAVLELQKKHIFHDVLPAFMEEKPFDRDALNQVQTEDVIFIPFFVSDGLHSREEIPVHMGLIRKTQTLSKNPISIQKKDRSLRAWYTAAIGMDPSISDIIVRRADEAKSKKRSEEVSDVIISNQKIDTPSLNNIKIGNILISIRNSKFSIRNKLDINLPQSRLKNILFSEENVDRLARFDRKGKYRPLRSDIRLGRGWILNKLSKKQALRSIEILQPLALKHWDLHRNGRLIIRSYKEVAARQSGIYRTIKNRSEDQIKDISKKCCGTGCSKTPFWGYRNPKNPIIQKPASALNIPCPEPCSWFLEQVRRKV
jgi:sirohydrochlorin cobaltochelatase